MYALMANGTLCRGAQSAFSGSFRILNGVPDPFFQGCDGQGIVARGWRSWSGLPFFMGGAAGMLQLRPALRIPTLPLRDSYPGSPTCFSISCGTGHTGPSLVECASRNRYRPVLPTGDPPFCHPGPRVSFALLDSGSEPGMTYSIPIPPTGAPHSVILVPDQVRDDPGPMFSFALLDSGSKPGMTLSFDRNPFQCSVILVFQRNPKICHPGPGSSPG